MTLFCPKAPYLIQAPPALGKMHTKATYFLVWIWTKINITVDKKEEKGERNLSCPKLWAKDLWHLPKALQVYSLLGGFPCGDWRSRFGIEMLRSFVFDQLFRSLLALPYISHLGWWQTTKKHIYQTEVVRLLYYTRIEMRHKNKIVRLSQNMETHWITHILCEEIIYPPNHYCWLCYKYNFRRHP